MVNSGLSTPGLIHNSWQPFFAISSSTFTATGGALYMTTVISLVSKEAGVSERGLVLGAFNTTSWFGRALGPLLIALLALLGFGRNAPLFAAALIMLPCIALVLGLRSRAGEISQND